MKNIKITYLMVTVLSAIIFACADEELVTLNPSASIEPSASSTSLVLSQEEEGTDAVTISWPQPDFGFSASPTYMIYIDREGTDFTEAIAINNSGATSKTFKVEELNRHLINLDFEPNEVAQLAVKVVARLGTTFNITSDVIALEATPYSSFLDLSTTWGVVGSGYNDWGAFPDAPFFASGTANVIVAYVELIDGYIKFRENNDWTNNFGDNGADGVLEAGGSDIPVTAGRYKITWNTSDNTYSIVPFTWGIVGSAYNDWGGDGPDFPFTYDDATNQWRAIVNLKAGEFKIRKNNEWVVDYGDTGGDGSLEQGGSNITVEAGKYQITFSEENLTIVIEEIPHIWGLVGSAYNDWGGAGPDAQFQKDWRNEGVWILKNVTLMTGQFKIRDSNDWGTNYGDSGADGSLDAGGTDISIEAGIYTITLNFSDPENPTWTKVKH